MREIMQFKWSKIVKTLLTYISASIIFCHFEISGLEYTVKLPTLVSEVGFYYCVSSKNLLIALPIYKDLSKSCVK